MDIVMPNPGKYVIAVSGGVDSMALLHLLQAQPDVQLMVAHFDHGIRPDSAIDRQLVQATAKRQGLPFFYEEGKLGPSTSEAKAREARYSFLREVQHDHKADKIITAHHQDDVLETAIINLLRGTGRKGLTSLRTTDDIERPLLQVTKSELVDYANVNQLEWREDSTNQDDAYLRNYVRNQLLPAFDVATRQQFAEMISRSRLTDKEIDTLLVKYQLLTSQELPRSQFVQLPHAVAREMMAAWLRQHGIRDFDHRTIERLVVAAKTGRPGQLFPVMHGASLEIKRGNLALKLPER
jgi:tRNA(Ile)-lysidine synthase